MDLSILIGGYLLPLITTIENTVYTIKSTSNRSVNDNFISIKKLNRFDRYKLIKIT